MSKGPPIVDANLQKIQTCVGKALVPMISMINDIGESKGKQKNITDYAEPLNDAIRLGCAAFSFLSQGRRGVVQNDIDYPLSKLCTWKHEIGTEQLFEDDIVKRLREVREQNKQFNSLSGRGSYGGGFSSGHGGTYCNGYGGGSRFKKFKMNKKSYGRFKNKSTKYSDRSKKNNKGKTEVCLDAIIECNLDTHSAPQFPLSNTPEILMDGKLADHIDEWQKLTSDRWILDIINGYTVEFDDIPCQDKRPHEM